MNRRERLLEASRLAHEYRETYYEVNQPGLNIEAVLQSLRIPLVFRPLTGLVGATISFPDMPGGIMVSTKRNYAVQRLTMAHELGHVLLEHPSQFDVDRLGQVDANAGHTPLEELEAETFALELMAPQHHLMSVCDYFGWGPNHVVEPAVLYQLSLRLGISYEATIRTLWQHGFLKPWQTDPLLRNRGKDLPRAKQGAAGAKPATAMSDAWVFFEEDDGFVYQAGAQDTFRFEADEMASAGYSWHLSSDEGEPRILDDDVNVGDEYGSASRRRFTWRYDEQGSKRFDLAERRAWNNDESNRVAIHVDCWERNLEAESRYMRQERFEEMLQ